MRRLRQWARRLKQDVMTLWFAWRDPATPFAARLLIAIVLAYALSPIDLIPDFIPVLGLLDDLLLLPLVIWIALRLIPPATIDASRARAMQWQADARARPRSWIGAAAIVVVWLLAAWLLARWFSLPLP